MLPTIYLKHSLGYIEIKCNKPELVQYICFRECIYYDIPKDSIITGKVFVYIDNYLFEKRLKRCDYNPEQFTPKTSPMYINNITNQVFDVSNAEVFITHYPFPEVSVFQKDNVGFYSIVHDTYDCVTALRTGIKKCLAQHFYKNGFFSLHATAIQFEGKCDIFIASTRCGKSTLYANLVSNGFRHVSDDIVFVKYSNGYLYTVSVPILPSIRETSVEFISHNTQIESTTLLNEDDTQIKILRINNLPFPGYDLIKVRSVSKLVLGSGFEDSLIKPDSDLKKTLLKSLTWHLKLSPSKELFAIVNTLLSVEWHLLVLSDNPDENINGLTKRKGGEQNGCIS